MHAVRADRTKLDGELFHDGKIPFTISHNRSGCFEIIIFEIKELYDIIHVSTPFVAYESVFLSITKRSLEG